jgi:hypothetical protein
MKPPSLLDQQAIATLSAGGLLIAISFLTNYGHGAFFHFSALPLDEQIGVSLHTAALAALNWRPVFEIEQETAWLRHVNARFDALSQQSDLSSQTPPQADCD